MEQKVYNILLSGLGGQGILFISKVLAEAAIRQGYLVRGAETHGMAQRGGSVVGHLRIGDVSSSLIRQGTAHCLLSLDEIEAYRNINFLAPKGVLCVNTKNREFPIPQISEFLKEKEIKAYGLDCLEIALKQDLPQSTNIAVVGFFVAMGISPISYAYVKQVVEELGKGSTKEKNLKILEEAYKEGQKLKAL